MRVRSGALAAAAVLVGLLALRTVHHAPELGYVPWSARGAVALLLPGLVAVAVALPCRRDRHAILLGLAGIASLVPELSVPGTRPALAFTAGLVLAGATAPLVAQLALLYPARTPGAAARALIATGYGTAIAALGLLPALAFDPVASGCGDCAPNLVGLSALGGLEAPLARAGMVAALAWAAAGATAILARLLRGTPTDRRLHAPVLLGAAALLAAFAAELARSVGRGYLDTGPADRALWLAGQAGLLLVALGVAARRARTRRAGAMLARDVVELSDPARHQSVAERLGLLLGDPALEVVYPGTRAPSATTAGRAATLLRAPDGRPLATLLHREGLLDDPAMADEIASTAGLALAHERLTAEARARLAELQASRRRIVEAADAERRRIERDLHDGAQQRLVTLAVALRAARSANGHDLPGLDAAQAELTEALAEVRAIARGLHPAVLSDMGLAAAIEALAETAPLPLKVGELPLGRAEPWVEAAAYFAVSEIVRDPAAGRVGVRGRRDAGALRLSLTTDAPACDVTRIADRVGAAGGTVHERRSDGRIVLDMEMPCAS